MAFLFLCCSFSTKSVVEPTAIDVSNAALLERILNIDDLNVSQQRVESIFERSVTEDIVVPLVKEKIQETIEETVQETVQETVKETIQEIKTKIESDTISDGIIENNLSAV
jgi:hypothetical protein